MQLDLFVLHSARRPRKMGRLKFVYDHLRGYNVIKRRGVEAAGEIIEYPFGIFG